MLKVTFVALQMKETTVHVIDEEVLGLCWGLPRGSLRRGLRLLARDDRGRLVRNDVQVIQQLCSWRWGLLDVNASKKLLDEANQFGGGCTPKKPIVLDSCQISYLLRC